MNFLRDAPAAPAAEQTLTLDEAKRLVWQWAEFVVERGGCPAASAETVRLNARIIQNWLDETTIR